jgi:transcriptional regulator with XRE-family HTH domain
MEVRPDLDTQIKLAAVTGMSQTTVGRILKSRVSPTLEHVAQIAAAFGLSIAQIFAQDTERYSEINYDRKGYSQLSGLQKRKIESFIEFEISAHAVAEEAQKSRSGSVQFDELEKRRAERRIGRPWPGNGK